MLRAAFPPLTFFICASFKWQFMSSGSGLFNFSQQLRQIAC